MRPKIIDNDKGVISVEVDGKTKMSWFYADREDYREKMQHAHYWRDGFMCASGAPLTYPSEAIQNVRDDLASM